MTTLEGWTKPKTGKPTGGRVQRDVLAKRLEAAAREQPAWRELHARLLALGGELVVVLPEPHLDLILARGRAWGATKERVPGRRSDCHANVARLPSDRYALATGWALSASDGLWRQHSWGVNARGEPVETTEPRVAYYGVVLEGDEVAWFREANGGV